MKLHFQSYLRIVTAEIIKLRGTFAFWLTLLYPLGTVFLVSLFWISMRNSKNINTDQFINNLGNAAAFFLPFFIVLLISVACNIEHKSSMMKHVLALPVPRPLFYIGKFTGIMAFITSALVITIFLTYCLLFTCGLFLPKLGFGTNFNHILLIKSLVSAYLGAAFIYSFQYWLGMRLRNLTLPVAIGSALIILPIAILIIMGVAGLLTNKDDFTTVITYDPYSYPYSAAFNIMKTTDIKVFANLTLTYIFLSITALGLGAWEFNRRDIG